MKFPGNATSTIHSIEYTVTYWRDGKYEVDYVITKGANIWAVEVKSGASGKVSGLSRFRSIYPDARPLMIGAQGIPLKEFFSRDAREWIGS
jgi:hypothetical protein